ncbi:MAG: hypothetical protein AAFX06_33520 [Planctomycetota bacterium]
MIATTAWLVRFLFAGSIYRKVVVDPADASVVINSRYLWFIRRERRIAFADIQAVTYGYEDMAVDSYVSYAHNRHDWFTVGFRLRDDTEFHLFDFVGDGGFTNNGPLPDWCYWEEFTFDIVGGQEKRSRAFVELLATLIGVSVVPPRNF